jgi:hypothetical protein
MVLVVAGVVAGAVLGVLGGRLTAPTVQDRVAAVRVQAQEVSAGLRVLSIHAESDAASVAASGDGGAQLALQRADGLLTDVLAQAPWITTAAGADLRDRLHELERTAPGAAATPAFGAGTDRLAADVDRTFGVAG